MVMPTSPGADSLARARQAFETGAFDQAVALAEQALLTEPQNPHIWHVLGKAQQSRKRHAEAIVAFRETLQLNPELAEVHAGLGLALIELGKPKEAVASYQQAL